MTKHTFVPAPCRPVRFYNVSPTHGGVAWGEHAGAYLAEHGWALRWSRSDREFAASIGMSPQVVNRLLPDVFVALAELK